MDMQTVLNDKARKRSKFNITRNRERFQSIINPSKLDFQEWSWMEIILAFSIGLLRYSFKHHIWIYKN